MKKLLVILTLCTLPLVAIAAGLTPPGLPGDLAANGDGEHFTAYGVGAGLTKTTSGGKTYLNATATSGGLPTDLSAVTTGIHDANQGTAGVSGSALYQTPAGGIGGIISGTVNGINGIILEFQQAANLLFQTTQGMEIDPRFYGAACNTRYFVSGYGGGNNNFTTTQNGSAVVSISGFTPNNCTANPGNSCDNGKVFSMFGVQDVGPTWLAGVTTSPLTVISSSGANMTLATALQGTNTSGDDGGFDRTGVVLGGWNGMDDTNYIQNAIYFSAVYHGGKVVLPPNCLIHNLVPAGGGVNPGVWLAGNNGANVYGGPALPLTSVTPLYVSTNSYAEDPLFGINLCGSKGFKMTDVMMLGTVFQQFALSYYQGTSAAAIGSSCAMNLAPDSLFLQHNEIALWQVGFGFPLGFNRGITLNGQVGVGTNVLTVNSVSSTNYWNDYGANSGNSPTTPTPDWVVPGMVLHGAGIPANTIISSAISYLGGSTTGSYALSNTITAGVLAETMTTSYGGSQNNQPLFLSGKTENNQFFNDGFGVNGDFSDYRSTGDTYTGASVYYGPYTGGSTGNGGNSIYNVRVEESGNGQFMAGITLDLGAPGSSQGTYQFNGLFCQFNGPGCIRTRNVWNDISINGGVIQGNGVTITPNAQIILGGTGTRFSMDGVLFEKNNFAQSPFNLTSSYLLATDTGASVSQVSVRGGNGQTGYQIAPFDFSRAAVSTVDLDIPGVPRFLTTVKPTSVTGTNCSVSGLSGGVWSGSFLAGTTTAACTATLALPPTVGGQPWDCAMHDTTSGGTAWAITATTSTACSGTGPSTSGDTIQLEAR